MSCSLLWVRCLFDLFSISDFEGKRPLKWKFSKMSFWIRRGDTEVRFVTKFGQNWCCEVAPKGRLDYHTKKLAVCGTRPSPHFAQNGPFAPKIPWTLSPLGMSTYLVRIGCTVLELFQKDWFFGPKSQYNIGFQPTVITLEMHSINQRYLTSNSSTNYGNSMLAIVFRYELNQLESHFNQPTLG